MVKKQKSLIVFESCLNRFVNLIILLYSYPTYSNHSRYQVRHSICKLDYSVLLVILFPAAVTPTPTAPAITLSSIDISTFTSTLISLLCGEHNSERSMMCAKSIAVNHQHGKLQE